ncbi:MAG: hypothetical protein ABSB33_11065, partial [Tepidisphaeraceae bacterium]
MTNAQKKKASAVAGKLSSSFRGLLFGAEAAEVNIVMRNQVIGRSSRSHVPETRRSPRHAKISALLPLGRLLLRSLLGFLCHNDVT